MDQTAQMARQASQAASEAVTNSQANIGQLRQQGQIAGTGGLSSFEQGEAGLKQSATAGAASLAGTQAANRLAATGQSASTLASQAQGTLAASGQQQGLSTSAANQALGAAGGLTSLAGLSAQQQSQLMQQILQSQQQTGQLTTEQEQILAELSKNPGAFQTGLGNVVALAGAAGGVMKGIGSLP